MGALGRDAACAGPLLRWAIWRDKKLLRLQNGIAMHNFTSRQRRSCPGCSVETATRASLNGSSVSRFVLKITVSLEGQPMSIGKTLQVQSDG
jgi:hypothetical protein